MPTTRRQTAIAEGRISPDSDKKPKPTSRKSKSVTSHASHSKSTIERGHIYFFYRPRVQLEEAYSINDVKNFHILLIPRPPEFAMPRSDGSGGTQKEDLTKTEEPEMKVLQPGADAVPAASDPNTKSKKSKLITVGKKQLPDPEETETFWATVTAMGDDLDALEAGVGAKSYETKMRGYAIINADTDTPLQREMHLGYHVLHPNPHEMGSVQSEFGIYSASSFVLQIRNPLTPATGPMQAHAKLVQYPDSLMREVFGAGVGNGGAKKGREPYGLRFASCETPELLDYKDAQLLLIAARDGKEGLEISLGKGRGKGLGKLEECEGHGPLRKVFDKLGLDLDRFPIESLAQGSWI
ncbi:hypothetical protein HYPSUDRAFT_66210 [Hypholoma sublateritium FD-334 SS-4]|uniref:Uncharacterized protein n=1 Tax=Hypholoma sublateritium (strain FD-334 SS-4) TaxID=945553 RepID=A0A0D2PVE4_HYPSF|nr:hypothetical protein HYPSUDRAFT_66210 [Hypholoma sublateritium FD-334 SS-4]